ncbi:MAG: 4Fe-4S binding protein [Candidatus Gastranaerophilales bacterium]|nr:4Fe-4S binding protein [Candidatus Gastranaerophilales bacterium]
MLIDVLNEKKCFKLVCGAGNEDVEEVEKLVYIYSLAGANFFDVCANLDVLKAAKRGLKRAGIEKDRYLCVSVGIDGDPHITKAQIDSDLCIKCQICQKNCPHQAISTDIEINEARCIGCGICKGKCPNNAIKMKTKTQDFDEILPPLISCGIDCVEFHAISKNEDDVINKWQKILFFYDGMTCISVDRSTSGDKDLIELVSKMVDMKKPYSTIIQADGVAMSGNSDEFGTTLQAVATAQMFQNSKIKAYIMMSGGTNSKSIELAKMCKIEPHCLAVGSYARKIVKDYLDDESCFENALEKAHALVGTILND